MLKGRPWNGWCGVLKGVRAAAASNSGRVAATAYVFILTSLKRINPGVEMHLVLEFICW